MKVLMISGDKNLLKTGAEARERLAIQTSAVEQLDVFVWPQVHNIWEICRSARKNNYDVVTTQDPFWRGLIGWCMARMSGSRLNLQVHADLKGQSFIKRALAHFTLRQADSIRVVSEKIKKDVQNLGITMPVRVLPIYIEASRFKGLEPKKHSQKTILWIGRFENEKDPLDAIRVLKEVRAKNVDAKLIMLGAGSLEQRMRRAAKQLPVEFPGWHDPISYLQVADVVLCTSRHESWGASIVEALAAGVPVVAPDVGIARESGAIVVLRFNLGTEIAKVLNSGQRGELKLNVPSADEWANQWRGTLV